LIPAPTDRTITPNEVAVLRWLLDHAPVGDVAAYRLSPLEELHVVGGCDCCSSLFFHASKGGSTRRIADAVAVFPDGQDDLMLWGRDGQIVWLEVICSPPNGPHPLPDIANLRTWEERGLELL
jgi:hypothetical protein